MSPPLFDNFTNVSKEPQGSSWFEKSFRVLSNFIFLNVFARHGSKYTRPWTSCYGWQFDFKVHESWGKYKNSIIDKFSQTRYLVQDRKNATWRLAVTPTCPQHKPSAYSSALYYKSFSSWQRITIKGNATICQLAIIFSYAFCLTTQTDRLEKCI